MLYAERRTILPPRPTLARRLLACTIALWFAALACLRVCGAALGRPARRALAIARERWAPAPLPELMSSVPERRLTELLADLQKAPALFLAGASTSATKTVTRVG